jgi:hypothetical protein
VLDILAEESGNLILPFGGNCFMPDHLHLLCWKEKQQMQICLLSSGHLSRRRDTPIAGDYLSRLADYGKPVLRPMSCAGMRISAKRFAVRFQQSRQEANGKLFHTDYPHLGSFAVEIRAFAFLKKREKKVVFM